MRRCAAEEIVVVRSDDRVDTQWLAQNWSTITIRNRTHAHVHMIIIANRR